MKDTTSRYEHIGTGRRNLAYILYFDAPINLQVPLESIDIP